MKKGFYSSQHRVAQKKQDEKSNLEAKHLYYYIQTLEFSAVIIHYSTLIMALAYIFIQNQLVFKPKVLLTVPRASDSHTQVSITKMMIL